MRSKEQVQADIDKYRDWLEVADVEDKQKYCHSKIESLQSELQEIEKNEAIQRDMEREQKENERIQAEVDRRLKEKEKQKTTPKDKKISQKQTKKPNFNPEATELDNTDEIVERASKNAQKIKNLPSE